MMFKGTAITNEEEHRDAVDEVESLFGSDPGTPGNARAHILVDMIQAYERGMFTVSLASSEARDAFRQEQMSVDEFVSA